MTDEISNPGQAGKGVWLPISAADKSKIYDLAISDGKGWRTRVPTCFWRKGGRQGKAGWFCGSDIMEGDGPAPVIFADFITITHCMEVPEIGDEVVRQPGLDHGKQIHSPGVGVWLRDERRYADRLLYKMGKVVVGQVDHPTVTRGGPRVSRACLLLPGISLNMPEYENDENDDKAKRRVERAVSVWLRWLTEQPE